MPARSRESRRGASRLNVRLVSCKFRGTARKSGVHTRTAYKLIPVCRRRRAGERRAQGKAEERTEVEGARRRIGERERERGVEKNWPTGLITSPGPGLTLGPASKSPTRTTTAAAMAGWRLVPRDFSGANRATREKTVYVKALCLGVARVSGTAARSADGRGRADRVGEKGARHRCVTSVVARRLGCAIFVWRSR